MDSGSLADWEIFTGSDGKMLVAATEPGVLRFWDTATGTQRCQIESSHGAFVAFTPDGQSLLEIRNVGLEKEWQVRLWDPVAGKMKQSAIESINSSLISLFDKSPGELCMSADGKFLAKAYGRAVCIWDLTTGGEIGPKGGRAPVRSLAFAPDGKHLVTLADLNELQLWEADTGRPGQKLERCTYMLKSPLDYSYGRFIEAKPYEPQAPLIRWDIQTGKADEVTAFPGMPPIPSKTPPPAMPGYAVSADGRWQLWWSKDGTISLVDRKTSKVIQHLSIEYGCVEPLLTISADGQSILCCNSQNGRRASRQIEVWSAATGKQLMKIEVNMPSERWNTMDLSEPVKISQSASEPLSNGV